jgi:uncharacterized protein (TIGR02284 family)
MPKNNYQPVYSIIALLDDAEKGYLTAAEEVNDKVLSTLFENYGYQRGRYSAELVKLVKQKGVSSAIDFFTLSLLQRTWRDLSRYFKYGKNAMIKACIKSEEIAIKSYNDALDKINDDTCEIKKLLQKQVNGIKAVLQFIKLYSGDKLQKI